MNPALLMLLGRRAAAAAWPDVVAADSPLAWHRMDGTSFVPNTAIPDESGNSRTAYWRSSNDLARLRVASTIPSGGYAALWDNDTKGSGYNTDIFPARLEMAAGDWWSPTGLFAAELVWRQGARGDNTGDEYLMSACADWSATGGEWHVGMDASNVLVAGGTGLPNITTTEIIEHDWVTPHHLALVLDGTNMSIWLDGELVGQSPCTAPLPKPASPITVANWPFDSYRRSHPVIDEVAFYAPGSLTPARILAHAQAAGVA